MKFLSSDVDQFLYINLPYDHAQNTVVMSGLVLLVATWNCWISYKSGYAGLLVLHMLLLLNPQLIVELQPAQVFSISNSLEDVHLNWLYWFYFLIREVSLLFILIDYMIFPSPFLDVTMIFLDFCSSFSCKSIPHSGCSALHGVNPKIKLN